MDGEELRAARRRLGWTQEHLAGALELTDTFVGLMERGVKPIGRRTELAVQQLLADSESATLHHGKNPISELQNMLAAIEAAAEAVHYFRTSREKLSELSEPTARISIVKLAEELRKLLVDREEMFPNEAHYAR